MQEPSEAAPQEERPRIGPDVIGAAKEALRERGERPQATEAEREAIEEEIRSCNLEPADWERPLADSEPHEPRAIPRLLDSMGMTPAQLQELTGYARDNLMRANDTVSRRMFEAVCVAVAAVRRIVQGITDNPQEGECPFYQPRLFKQFVADVARDLLEPTEGTDRYRRAWEQAALQEGRELRKPLTVYMISEMLSRLSFDELAYVAAMVDGVANLDASRVEPAGCFQKAVQQFIEAEKNQDIPGMQQAVEEARVRLFEVLERLEWFGIPWTPESSEP